MSETVRWTARLEQDGLLERADGVLRTTRRWHAVLARAAQRLYQEGHELADMRTPIAAALLECYEDEPIDSLADGIRAMSMVAMSELVTLAPSSR